MAIVVSSTEPKQLRALGISNTSPERFGCDFLISSKHGVVGVQRKKHPQDLVASILDGRLSGQVAKMGELDRFIVLLEGFPSFTRDGGMVFDNHTRQEWTFDQVYKILMSLSLIAGAQLFWVRDKTQTAMFLNALNTWWAKGDHDSLLNRPGARSVGWTKADSKFAKQIHFMQGFAGVGVGTAKAILEHFDGALPIQLSVTRDELLAVPGVGPKTVDGILETLNGRK